MNGASVIRVYAEGAIAFDVTPYRAISIDTIVAVEPDTTNSARFHHQTKRFVVESRS